MPGCSPEQNGAGRCCKGGIYCLSAHSLPGDLPSHFSVNTSLFPGHSRTPQRTRVQLSWVPSVLSDAKNVPFPGRCVSYFTEEGVIFRRFRQKCYVFGFWFVFFLCEMNTWYICLRNQLLFVQNVLNMFSPQDNPLISANIYLVFFTFFFLP